MPEAPFPMAVDSTMRAAFTSCPHKYYREYFQHWKRIAESPAATFLGIYTHGGHSYAESSLEAVVKIGEQDRTGQRIICFPEQ